MAEGAASGCALAVSPQEPSTGEQQHCDGGSCEGDQDPARQAVTPLEPHTVKVVFEAVAEQAPAPARLAERSEKSVRHPCFKRQNPHF